MRVLLLVCATLFSLFLAELGLRFVFSPNQFLDRTTDAYWAADFDQQMPTGDSDSRAVEADTVFDPDLGWRMRPGYHAGNAQHNSRGFRENGLGGQADSNSLVLTIGDSFTYGLGVGDSETFSAVLSRETNRQVINAGVNAYGVDQALLMWELEGKKTSPDTVILGFFVDDFFRNALSIRDRPKPCFVYDESTRAFRFQPIDLEGHQTANQVTGTGSPLRVIDAASWMYRELEVRLFPNFDEELQEKAKLSRFLLTRLDESVKASGAELLIVIIGNCFDQSPNYRWVESSIEEICETESLECINVAASMRSSGSSRYFGSNCHWSREGHEFAAAEIKNALDSNR